MNAQIASCDVTREQVDQHSVPLSATNCKTALQLILSSILHAVSIILSLSYSFSHSLSLSRARAHAVHKYTRRLTYFESLVSRSVPSSLGSFLPLPF